MQTEDVETPVARPDVRRLPKPAWEPSPERARAAGVTRYLQWLAARGRPFRDYSLLYTWSVEELEQFWGTLWQYFDLGAGVPTTVLSGRDMPGARWFPESSVNYAGRMLLAESDRTAVIAVREDGRGERLSYHELRAQVGAVAAGLRRMGVVRGDRVCGVLPNSTAAAVTLLAAASLGAIWSVCPPEFGIDSVIERFTQIEPKVLVLADGYTYAGRVHDRIAYVAALGSALPSVESTVLVPYQDPHATAEGTIDWNSLVAGAGDVVCADLPFDHPLWILYSSGTTGPPKPIVHSHGGILLEHLKALTFHTDLHPDDVFFWFTTTGWMMWNYLVSGLLVGATVVLYDGSPTHPGPDSLWRMAARFGVTVFGTSPAFLARAHDGGIVPRELDDLVIHTVCSTGSTLPPEQLLWATNNVGEDVMVSSSSGGTDVCTGFVGSVPTMPIYPDEIQNRMLGCAVVAMSDSGTPLVGQVGELVLTAPMPSMPTAFWNDPDGERFRRAYFEKFPGQWHHGDWIEITARGGCKIFGRSDATLNRGGVRMGTAEFYRVVESRPDVADSLVVDTGELWLFVVPANGAELDTDAIRAQLRAALSARHVPDHIVAVSGIPRTRSGKKCEVPVKRILMGHPPQDAITVDTLADADALLPFIELGERA